MAGCCARTGALTSPQPLPGPPRPQALCVWRVGASHPARMPASSGDSAGCPRLPCTQVLRVSAAPQRDLPSPSPAQAQGSGPIAAIGTRGAVCGVVLCRDCPPASASIGRQSAGLSWSLLGTRTRPGAAESTWGSLCSTVTWWPRRLWDRAEPPSQAGPLGGTHYPHPPRSRFLVGPLPLPLRQPHSPAPEDRHQETSRSSSKSERVPPTLWIKWPLLRAFSEPSPSPCCRMTLGGPPAATAARPPHSRPRPSLWGGWSSQPHWPAAPPPGGARPRPSLGEVQCVLVM